MKKTNSASSANTLKKVLSFVLVFVMASVLMVVPAFADESDQIVVAVKSGLEQAYKIVTAVGLPIAAILMVIQGLKLMGDERTAATAKRNMLWILLGIAVMYLAPILIYSVSNIFSNVSNNASAYHQIFGR